MADLQLAPEAEADLDDIWFYVAEQSSSLDVADRFIDSVTQRFGRSPNFRFPGAAATICVPVFASSPLLAI